MNVPIPSDAMLKVLDSEPVRNLLSPVTKQVGLLLGDLGEILRFYSQRNLGKIFARWAESGRVLDVVDFEKVMPLLLLAATASDGELQNRWAFLLESAVTDTEGFLPSFGRTLSELTAEEAQFLDRLWNVVSEPNRYLSEHRPGREPLSYLALVKIFDSTIETGINPAEIEAFSSKMPFAQIANYERLGQAELVIQDLERLGILTHEPVAEPDRYLPLGDQKIPFHRSTIKIRSEYSLTGYGVSFIRAVTERKAQGG